MNWMRQAIVSSFGGDQCGGQERSATASRRIPVAGDARAHFEARIPSITSFQSLMSSHGRVRCAARACAAPLQLHSRRQHPHSHMLHIIMCEHPHLARWYGVQRRSARLERASGTQLGGTAGRASDGGDWSRGGDWRRSGPVPTTFETRLTALLSAPPASHRLSQTIPNCCSHTVIHAQDATSSSSTPEHSAGRVQHSATQRTPNPTRYSRGEAKPAGASNANRRKDWK